MSFALTYQGPIAPGPVLNPTSVQAPVNMPGGFEGLASLMPSGFNTMMAGQQVVGNRLDLVRGFGMENGAPGSFPGGAPDYGASSDAFIQAMNTINDATLSDVPTLPFLDNYAESSQGMYSEPTLDLRKALGPLPADETSVFTNAQAVLQAQSNSKITTRTFLNRCNYSDIAFSSWPVMQELLPDEMWPIFALIDKDPHPGNGDTLLTLPEVNHQFYLAYRRRIDGDDSDHPVYGDAFRNPTKFLERFVFAGYNINMELFGDLRESSSCMVDVAFRYLIGLNIWIGCEVDPTDGAHLFLQFVKQDLLTNPGVTDKPSLAQVMPFGLGCGGDEFPSKEVLQGTHTSLYQLIPDVQSGCSAPNAHLPLFLGRGRSLPRVHVGVSISSRSPDSLRQKRYSKRLHDLIHKKSTVRVNYDELPMIDMYVPLKYGVAS